MHVLVLNLRRSLLLSVLFFVLLGLAYPLAELGVGQVAFSHQANGSLSAEGSTLVGQYWNGPRWFQGRPDADNPMATGGTNLGPRSKALVHDVAQQRGRLEKEGITPTPDLVTTSGSGVDPDISPGAAYAQVPAIARARGIPDAVVRHVVAMHVNGPELGFLGAAFVNVLALNEALAGLR